MIRAALRAGRAWLLCPFVSAAHGAHLWAERDDGATIAMGADITDSGVYRVEARIDERLWLVSNPVHLR